MKILLGLSGGLDSTYAAYLLKSEGHDVVGAVIRMHDYSPLSPAVRSAEQAGIPLEVLDCREAFDREVITPFVSEYLRARTPNPCVLCNRFVKFGALFDYAEKNGFDRVATGHYAKILSENGRYFVRRADDGGKDQSYVLWKLTQKQLSGLYLPLMGEQKSEIREKARALGFEAAEAKESMENCFIPDNDYVGFIERRTGIVCPEGDFLDENGNKVGRHHGIIRYTVGQRKGLGIALGAPVFVTSIDPDRNTVTVGTSGSEFRSEMTVKGLSFQKLPPLSGEYSLKVKIRYAAKPQECRAVVDCEKDECRVFFSLPARAVTPGQSAVFYDDEDVAFGGEIE